MLAEGHQEFALDEMAIDAAAGSTLPPPAWAVRAGGGGFDRPAGVAGFADGSSIVVGYIEGSSTFGSTTLQSAGGRDAAIAKLGSDGSFAWATRFGGTGNDAAVAVAAISDGSAIVTGTFTGSVAFGSTTLTSAGGVDVFVAKLNAGGTFAWATRMGGANEDFIRGVTALADGSTLVAGSFSGSATFGSTTLTSAGGTDAVVAKVSATGSIAWATKAGGTGFDYGHGIAAFSDGGAIVTGYFNGSATFGSTTLTSAGNGDVFAAKLNSDGSYAWATRAGGAAFDYALGVATFTDGSSIVTGSYQGSASFGSTSLTTTTSGMFVSKLSTNGAFSWTRGTDRATAFGVSSLSDGSAVVTGNFSGTSTFGPLSLASSASGVDAFVAKVGSNGTYAWARRAGGTDGATSTYGRAISAFTDGSAIISGEFSLSGLGTNGKAAFGSTTLTSAGQEDFFVAKISAFGSFDPVPDVPTALEAASGNGSVSLTWTAPVANGTAAITDYVIEYKTTAATAWETFVDGVSTSPSATVTGLVNGVSYVFRVAAKNPAGTGGPSTASPSVTPRTVPGRPSLLSGSPGDARVTLTWSAPASDGGAVITDYVVQFKAAADATWTTFNDGVSTTRSTTVTGLANGSGYVFRVSAVNAAGTGSASDETPIVTPLGAPEAPTTVTATAHRGYATVSWNAPGFDGGTAITGYVVESSVDGGVTWSVSGQTAAGVRSVRLDSLLDGASYLFRVSANNAAGTGLAANTSAAIALPAQPDWPARGGGPGDDGASSVTTLDGATLVTGWFSGTATFGDTALTAVGAEDIFVAKLKDDGSYAWAVRAGGTGRDRGTKIAALDDGSVIVLGTSAGTATFGGTTLGPAGGDSFIAKVRSDGSFAWARRTGSSGAPVATAAAALAGGAVILTGTYSGSATLGSTTLVTNGVADAFLARLDAAGSYVWAVRAGAPHVPFDPLSPPTSSMTEVSPGGIATMADGSAYVAGWFAGGDVAFGDTVLSSTRSQWDRSLFVAKLTSSGTFAWAHQALPQSSFSSTTRNEVSGVAAWDDTVLVAGTFQGDLAIAGATLSGGASDTDVFVAKWSAAGSPRGAMRAGSSGDDYGGSVSGRIMTGIIAESATFGGANPPVSWESTLVSLAGFAPQVFVAAIDEGNLDRFSWAAAASHSSLSGIGQAPAISVLPDDSPVLAGQFTGTAVFGTTQFSSPGNGDAFVARMTSTGSYDRHAGRPTDVTGAPNDGRVSLTWRAPAYAGASAISDYLVEYSNDAGETWSVFADGVSTSTGATVTGLSNGTSYRFRVSAVNGAGLGRPALLSGAITPVSLRPAAWPKRLASSSIDSLGVFGDGSAVVTGVFSGSGTFGSTVVTGSNPQVNGGSYAARLDADGAFSWAREAPGSIAAAAADGATLVAGTQVMEYPGTYGSSGMWQSPFSATHMVVSQLKADGSTGWRYSEGATPNYGMTSPTPGYEPVVQPQAITTLPDGSVVVAGMRNDYSSYQSPMNIPVFFLRKINTDGSAGWGQSSSLPTTSWYGYHDTVTNLAAFSDGSTLLAGRVGNELPFGSNAPSPWSPSSGRAFVTKFAANGTVIWSRELGEFESPYGDEVHVAGLTTLPDGSALVAGAFSGTVTFGTTTLVATDASDGFIAKLAANGSVAWVQRIDVAMAGITALTDGSAVATGSFAGSLTVGTETLSSAGDLDAFILKIAPNGSFIWARSMGGTGSDAGGKIATLPDGTTVVAGLFSGTATFGPVSLTSTNATDTFLARIHDDGSLVVSLFDGTHTINAPATRVHTVGGSAFLTLGGKQTSVDSIVGGTVRLAADGGIVNHLAGGHLEISAASVIVATSGSPAISVTSGAVAEIQSGNIGGAITGAGDIRKTGSGTLTLIGVNNHLGTTWIDDGSLVVSGATGPGTIVVGPDASIGGTGRIQGSLRVQSQGTLTPGQRLGTLSTAAVEMAGSAILDWELADAAGTPGRGWDFVSSAGALTLTAANSQTPVVIRVITLAGTSLKTPGPAVNFDPAKDHRWLVGTFSGGINGFTPGCMAVDTSTFANTFDASRSAFSVLRDGDSLYVNYTAGASSVIVPSGQSVTDSTIRTGAFQLVKQGGGTLILDKANSHSGGTIVEAGTLVVENPAAFGTGAVVVKPGATIVIDPAAGTALLESLTIDPTGRVDLGTGSITIARGLSPEALVGLITAGRGDGLWTESSGLGSSAVAQAVAQGVGRTIGWLDNGDGSFTIGFAAPGDSNLDLMVDVLDAANFLAGGKYDAAQTTSWTEGDFNFDGMLDILDTADFLGTGLFDAGLYGAAGTVAADRSASMPDVAPTIDSASDLAFAALAAQQDETAARKRRVFAAFR